MLPRPLRETGSGTAVRRLYGASHRSRPPARTASLIWSSSRA